MYNIPFESASIEKIAVLINSYLRMEKYHGHYCIDIVNTPYQINVTKKNHVAEVLYVYVAHA